MKYPTIGLDGLTAGRLVFEHNGRQYIYDSRGHEFARFPQTGNVCTEPVENLFGQRVPLFGAYDAGWPKYFAFCYADCFDPPQYLICARSWEDAYDIFLDEFGEEYEFEAFTTPGQKIEADEVTGNGVATRTSGGRLVNSESVQGHELKLIRAERFET